jgi:hypothetical protein
LYALISQPLFFSPQTPNIYDTSSNTDFNLNLDLQTKYHIGQE